MNYRSADVAAAAWPLCACADCSEPRSTGFVVAYVTNACIHATCTYPSSLPSLVGALLPADQRQDVDVVLHDWPALMTNRVEVREYARMSAICPR